MPQWEHSCERVLLLTLSLVISDLPVYLMFYRPQWDRCSEVVAGGAGYWTKATEGKTSDQILDLLLTEIRDSDSTTVVDYFEGLVSANSSSGSGSGIE